MNDEAPSEQARKLLDRIEAVLDNRIVRCLQRVDGRGVSDAKATQVEVAPIVAALRGALAALATKPIGDEEREAIRRDETDIAAMAEFLVARIDDLDWCGDFPDLFLSDWYGHVDPALCRLRSALALSPDDPLPVLKQMDKGEL